MPRLPVFVSRPTRRTDEQSECYRFLLDRLDELDLEARTIEAAEYAFEHPLREVRALAGRCAGGLVIGFAHTRLASSAGRATTRATENERWHPTPWNNLEAGILYGLRLPLLIFRDALVDGGIFDPHATGEQVHLTPGPDARRDHIDQIRAVFRNWYSRVEDRYFTEE